MKPYPAPLVLLAVLVAGCATTPLPSSDKKIIVSSDQTEVVMPVGTHIRTRVLKGQKEVGLSPTDTVSGERVNDALLTRDGSFPSVPVR